MRIVVRRPDQKRWNLERLIKVEGEDMALAEQGLADWPDMLDLPLDSANRMALQWALISSQEDVEAGRLVDAEEVLRELRTA